MQTLANGFRGARVLVTLNLDRFLTTGTIILALYASAYFALQ